MIPPSGGDLSDAVPALTQAVPELIQRITAREATAHADDGDIACLGTHLSFVDSIRAANRCHGADSGASKRDVRGDTLFQLAAHGRILRGQGIGQLFDRDVLKEQSLGKRPKTRLQLPGDRHDDDGIQP